MAASVKPNSSAFDFIVLSRVMTHSMSVYGRILRRIYRVGQRPPIDPANVRVTRTTAEEAESAEKTKKNIRGIRPFRPDPRDPAVSLRMIAPILGAILLVSFPNTVESHEIPQSVAVRMYVKQEPGALRVVMRVPLEAIRDIDFPLRPGTPFIDRVGADSLLKQAVETWLLSATHVAEAGEQVLGNMRLARISLPSDDAFRDYATALSHTRGAPLDPRKDLTVQGAMLDTELEFPVSSHENVRITPALARLGVRTTSIVTFIALDGAERQLRYVGDPGSVRINPRWYHAAWQFVGLGFSHILAGIDHLLFVLCLVLPFRKPKPLVAIVTAFTIAHSITLAAASLGLAPKALWFPALVEVLIAASIAWMALENIVLTAQKEPARLERRWVLAFAFGLIHGFGFAFALGESLQFAGRHLSLALVSFNIGVELAQVAVLLIAVPLLSLLYRRVVAERIAVIVLSAFVTHTAWHWLGDRWAALREYQVDWSLVGMLPLIRLVMALAIGVALAVIVERLVRSRQLQRLAAPHRSFQE
jgi:hypothetical protein